MNRVIIAKATWACFDCRETIRRPKSQLKPIFCPKCSQAMGYLGDRIRIPAKRQAKAWRELWRSITGDETRSLTKAKDFERGRLIKRLEEDIKRLEATPKSKGREMKIRSYRKQLAKLMDWSAESTKD